MFSERSIYVLDRIPEKVKYSIWTLLLTLSANFVVKNIWWVGAIYAPLFFFLEALSRSERAVGFMVARRGTVAILCVALMFGVLLLLVYFVGYPGVERSTSGGVGASAGMFTVVLGRGYLMFFLVGAILGASIRYCFSVLMTLALLGKKRLGMNVLATAIWTFGIIMFPYFGRHHEASSVYIGGIGVGVLLSRSFRLRVARAVAAYRRVQDIADAWPPNAEAVPSELEALKLLADGRQFPRFRFSRLRRKLIEWSEGEDGIFTERLALVSASVFRLEGDHEHAIAEVDRALDKSISDKDEIVETEVAHLLLLKALSLYETGKDEDANQLILRIVDSPAGKFCPLSRATSAARQAEEVLQNPLSVRTNSQSLEIIYEALDLRKRLFALRAKRKPEKRESIDLFLTKFPEIGIPVTATFMRDILGLCHLAAGYAEEGRVFLESCIETDRLYSSSYLHLGEYFLFRKNLYGSKVEKRKDIKHDLWHARACFYAAQYVERNIDSRVRRQATIRLGQVTDFEGHLESK